MVRAAIFAIAFLCLTSVTYAQERHWFATTTPPDSSKYLEQHIIDVRDVPGHQIRIYEIQRTYTHDHLAVLDAKVVEMLDTGTSDYSNGVGPTRGYGIWTLDSGEKIFTEWLGTSESQASAAGLKKGAFHGTGRFIGGTGRFKTIRGLFTSVTEFDTDPKSGYNRPSLRGEYWLQE